MRKCNSVSFVRVITTLKRSENSWRRAQSIGHNVQSMGEISDLFSRLKDSNMSGISQIRIKPSTFEFTDPCQVADNLDGIKAH